MHLPTLSSYCTPDKRPQPDISTKGLSSATIKPWREAGSASGWAGSASQSQYRAATAREGENGQKLAWFETRVEQLRAYLDASPQIEQSRIREIFGWAVEHPPEEGIQQRILKDLSKKVRALIKENSELRGSSPADEVITLRREKAELEAMIGQLRRGESAREGILSEENQYLRDYISRSKDNNIHSQTRKEPIVVEQSSPEEPQSQLDISKAHLLPPATPGEVASLRKYVMAYINTVIEANDEKLQAQQKYLLALEKRMNYLGKCEQMLNHLRFEKEVKLQESSRKSKNFTAGAPNIPGDHLEYEPDTCQPLQNPPSSPHPPPEPKQPYFSGKSTRKQSEKKQSPTGEKAGKELAALVLRSAQLQEELSSLQEKYEVEIENHIRDSSDREELVITIQKLNAEKNDLKHQVFDLSEQLRGAQKRVGQLEKGAGKLRMREELLGRSISIEQELADIQKELISCGVEHYEAVEQQLAHVFAERDRLRRDLQKLQGTRAEQSRFSSATKQIFLLREKNSQLQQNCRFYQQQIQQYEQQLRQISQESEEQLARAISRDFKQMRGNDQELEGLKWPRLAHSCMINSIARLENLQKQLAQRKP